MMVSIFACCNSRIVDVPVSINKLILIFDDSHLPDSSSDIRPWNVHCSSQTCLLAERSRIVPSYSLQFSFGKSARVHFYSSLGSTVRQSRNNILNSHQGRKCFHFLEVNFAGVTRSSFGWQFVGFVLNPVRFNNFDQSCVWMRRRVPVR